MQPLDGTVEEILQFEYALGRMGVFVGRYPADGGLVHSDIFGDIPQHHWF